MAAFLVGGVECRLEETQITVGHLAVTLADIVAFGVANGPSELVIVYERRAEERGYRETRGRVRARATTTLALHGEHDLLIAWLRQRIPDRWRGYAETVVEIVDGPSAVPPTPPIGLGKIVAVVAALFVLVMAVAVVWMQTVEKRYHERKYPPQVQSGPED